MRRARGVAHICAEPAPSIPSSSGMAPLAEIAFWASGLRVERFAIAKAAWTCRGGSPEA